MWIVHNLNEAAVDKLPKKGQDRYPPPGAPCPKCDGEKLFSRKSFLLKHLTSKIHSLSEMQAKNLLEPGVGDPVVEESSEERSYDRSEERSYDRSQELGDDGADRDSDGSWESNNVVVTEAECEARTGLVYLDQQRRCYRCHMCPVAHQDRMRLYLPVHMKCHKLSPPEIENMVASLEAQTVTLTGQVLGPAIGQVKLTVSVFKLNKLFRLADRLNSQAEPSNLKQILADRLTGLQPSKLPHVLVDVLSRGPSAYAHCVKKDLLDMTLD